MLSSAKADVKDKRKKRRKGKKKVKKKKGSGSESSGNEYGTRTGRPRSIFGEPGERPDDMREYLKSAFALFDPQDTGEVCF